jgi:phospholipase C
VRLVGLGEYVRCHGSSSAKKYRFSRVVGACAVGLLSAAGLMAPAAVLAAPAAAASEVAITSSGLHPGAIKHVWLIILENKSFDATFSGLNQNTYLWKTLPAQGVG